jgi:hypothetical protein
MATPVTKEDLRKLGYIVDEPAQEPGELEAFGRGTAQGLTFGFADEITGAAEAAYGGLTGDERDFLERYRQATDESRAAYKAAEESSPVISMVGNVVGGLAPAIISGGTSLAPKVGATIGQKIASAATAGALSGAVSGAGTSESADLTGMAKDAIMGAVGGGVLGGAAGVGGKVAATTIGAGIGASLSPEDPLTGASIGGGVGLAGSTALRAIKESSPAGIMSAAFKRGEEGVDLRSNQSNQQLKERFTTVSKESEEALERARISAQQQQAELKRQGKDVSIRTWYEQAKAAIAKAKEEFGADPKVSEELSQTERLIDNYILGKETDLDIPIRESSGANQRRLEKLENKLEQLNVREQAKREAQLNAEPYRAAGQGGELRTPDDTPYEYLSRAGVLQKAKALKRNPETGELMPTLGDTELNAAFEDIARTNANAALPFEKQQVQLGGKQYETIADVRSGKIMTEAVPVESSVPMVESVQTVPVRFPATKGEEMLAPTAQVSKLKGAIGKYGSKGETPLSTPEGKSLVNRLLSPVEGRELSATEQAMGFTKETPTLKGLEELGGGKALADTNKFLSNLFTVEKEIPDLMKVISESRNTPSALDAYKKIKDYKSTLSALKEQATNPELKLRAEKLEQNLAKAEELSRDVMLHSEITSKGLSQDLTDPRNWLATSSRGFAYGGANWAGLQTKAAKDTVTAVGKKLYEMTPETLQNTATKISQRFKDSPTAQKFAQQLSMASGKDHIKRNALLFTLQQNPAYREFIQQLGDDDGQ